MPRHVIIKCLKADDKQIILEEVREKGHIIYRGKHFSSETAGQKEISTLKMLKEKNYQL